MNNHVNSADQPESVDGQRQPVTVSRRRLLQMLGIGGVMGATSACSGTSLASSSKTPKSAKSPKQSKSPGSTKSSSGKRTANPGAATPNISGPGANRVLVVLEMQGGHDGFSMLVPYGDARFRSLRERGWTDPKELHVLDDRYALAKGLAPIADRLSLIEGVGVAKPDLSHFAMLQRWWHGDPDGVGNQLTGFLGRCCDVRAGSEPVTGLTLGGGSTPSLITAKATTVALPALDSVRELSVNNEENRRLKATLAGLANNGLVSKKTLGTSESTDNLIAAARRGLVSSIDLSTMVGRIGEAPKGYPENDIASALSMSRQLISLDAGIRIIHIPWGSFDTHSGSVGTHNDHMVRLGAALAAFDKDLKANGLGDRVLLASTSEFGRRPEANQSGTDHGTASTMMLLGPTKPGRHGSPPNFGGLDGNGNVKATVSMADYYATLAQWLGIDPSDVLSKGATPIDTLGIS